MRDPANLPSPLLLLFRAIRDGVVSGDNHSLLSLSALCCFSRRIAPPAEGSWSPPQLWSLIDVAAPYQVIHVGAAAPTIPDALINQLASPGRMFIPVGVGQQGESVVACG